jgi:hypothetical protein
MHSVAEACHTITVVICFKDAVTAQQFQSYCVATCGNGNHRQNIMYSVSLFLQLIRVVYPKFASVKD